MKYKVLTGPVQTTADTQAQTGEIVDLPEADGTQLARWGVVGLVAEEEAAPEPPQAPATTPVAKTATTTTKTATDSDTTTTAK